MSKRKVFLPRATSGEFSTGRTEWKPSNIQGNRRCKVAHRCEFVNGPSFKIKKSNYRKLQRYFRCFWMNEGSGWNFHIEFVKWPKLFWNVDIISIFKPKSVTEKHILIFEKVQWLKYLIIEADRAILRFSSPRGTTEVI